MPIDYAWRTFLTEEFFSPISVTLTLKGNLGWRNSNVYFNNLDWFISNRLNRKLYGRACLRGLGLNRVVAVLEKTENDIWHFHVQIDLPDGVPFETMKKLIEDLWPLTHWGMPQVDVQRTTGDRWLNYMLKKRTKPALVQDCICMQSMRKSDPIGRDMLSDKFKKLVASTSKSSSEVLVDTATHRQLNHSIDSYDIVEIAKAFSTRLSVARKFEGFT